MPSLAIPEKNPVKVAAGRAGAQKRWGDRRVVRLDSLDPRVRAAVLALVDADEAARKAGNDAA